MALYGYQPSKNYSQPQSVPPPKSSNEPTDKAKTTYNFADVKFKVVAAHSVGGVVYFDLCASGRGQPEKAAPPAKEPNWILVSHKIVGELEKHGCRAQVTELGFAEHWRDRPQGAAGSEGAPGCVYRIDLDKLPEDIDLVSSDDSDIYDEIWYRQDFVQKLRAENQVLRNKIEELMTQIKTQNAKRTPGFADGFANLYSATGRF